MTKRLCGLVLFVVSFLVPLTGCRRNVAEAHAATAAQSAKLTYSEELVATWDDLMLVRAAKVVARDDIEFGQSLGKTFDELTATLSPKYLKNMPATDAWGTPYVLVNGLVASSGSDRRSTRRR